MTNTTYTPAEALQAATAEGSIEMVCGVYLNSRENILADQADWADEDEEKRFDFSKAPFWITSPYGLPPQPVYGEDDEILFNVLAEA